MGGPRKDGHRHGHGAKHRAVPRKAVKVSTSSSASSRAPIAPSAAPRVPAVSKQRTADLLQQKRNDLRSMKVSVHRLNVSSYEELMGSAVATTRQFDLQQQQSQSSSSSATQTAELEVTDNSRRAFAKELRKVTERADVVLQVLDARDPLGCRSQEMEDAISRAGKKLVLVLNKVDLVPAHILGPWLAHLRAFYPTVAFKASTQRQGNNLSASASGRADRAAKELLTGTKAVGTDALMQLLKNYCRNAHLKTAITVGVIGYPNVGKSSVINSLKRSKAASVSSVAGHTKVMQEVHIDSKIKLLDCPGIVFDHSDASALLLRNCVNTESMADPVGAVHVILQKCDRAQLTALYGLPPNAVWQDVVGFLVLVAQTKGRLGKGGVPDRQAAARCVLQDWNRGKLQYFTPPPENKHKILDTQLVTSFSAELDLDTMLNPTTIFMDSTSESSDQAMETTGSSMESAMTAPGFASVPTLAPTASSQLTRSTMSRDDSDSNDSDSDMGGMDDEDSNLDTSEHMHSFNGTLISSKIAHDPLNPQATLMARRRAKQLRKQKRRDAKQRISQEAEMEVCEQMETMDM